MIKLATISILLAACASSARPAARFHNAAPVTVVDDRRDLTKAPKPRTYHRLHYQLRGNIIDPLTRPLELATDRRALGTNALDEVPNSTWFTNRIGVRDVTADELRAGPGTTGSPELHLPWTIVSTKVGGRNIGFIFKDARGEKFILKFDKLGFPETETAAGVIANRLIWGMGWNVPEDHVVYFRPADLVLAPDAKIKDVFGNARKLTRLELEGMLALVDAQPDGQIRALASRMLDGKWLGGHPGEGTRSDDPNDRIAHERRRDLRGSYAMFSWLDHTDVKEDNSLDMFVTDPADPSRHYVKHYQLDFGSALGSMARTNANKRIGHEYFLDFSAFAGALASLGLHERPWESRKYSAYRGVGLYDMTNYDPGTWKPSYAGYLPFHTADRVDKFWGSKVIIRFTREQLRAAVDAGRLSDPRAAEYLTDMLVARQRATAKYWFERTAPLDNFTVEEGAVCFDDLMRTYQLSSAATRYDVTLFDRNDKKLGAQPVMMPAGRTCTAPVALSADADGYTIVRITTTRLDRALSTYVHIARNEDGVRVIGVFRQ